MSDSIATEHTPAPRRKRSAENTITLADVDDSAIQSVIDNVHAKPELWNKNSPTYCKNNHQLHAIWLQVDKTLEQEGTTTVSGIFFVS